MTFPEWRIEIVEIVEIVEILSFEHDYFIMPQGA